MSLTDYPSYEAALMSGQTMNVFGCDKEAWTGSLVFDVIAKSESSLQDDQNFHSAKI
jgi:hypothetical protein